MKSFKKHIFIFLILIVGSFIGVEEVDAASLDYKDVTLECIYNDGGVYEYSYNEYLGQKGEEPYAINRYAYNLRGISTQESYTSTQITYVNSPNANEGNSERPKCYSYVHVASLTEGSIDDGDLITTTYIKFSNVESTEFVAEDFMVDDWYTYIWGFSPWLDKKAANKSKKTFGFVAENYILTENATDANAILSYKRENVKSDDETSQVVSNPDYVSILVYDNIILAKGKKKTTYLENNNGFAGISINLDTGEPNVAPPQALFLSDAEPKTYSGSGSTISYYYNAPLYQQKSSGLRYAYAGVGSPEDLIDTGELCTKIMPETAQTLAKIIGWTQILVPILLIASCF